MSDDEHLSGNEIYEEDDEEQEIFDDGTEYTEPGQQKVEKPSKDEKNVAKWLKKNVKTKKTKFLSHIVEYFTSSKAIDALMKSKFAEGDQALFTTREQAVEFLDVMLEHKFFHRAKKVPVTVEEIRGKADKRDGDKKSQDKEKDKSESGDSKAQQKSSKDDKKDADHEADSGKGDGNETVQADKKEKKKRKIRLDMHPEQIFVDGSEAYVWIYDPIPLHYWIFGLILLLGAVGICLFPLWPPLLRKGVYYLSIAAAGFLVFILGLTVLRLIVFTIVWALTGGKLHFWIFPNLTEDVGFFASFWPLYESNYVSDTTATSGKTDKKSSKSKSKKKDKDSDAEEDTAADVDHEVDAEQDPDADIEADADGDVDATPLEPEKIEQIKEHDADMEVRKRRKIGADDYEDDDDEDDVSQGSASQKQTKDTKAGTPRNSESESESSSKDYEIISSSEVQNVAGN
ncbi:translocation protein SEC62 isoform X1 [Scaptodrosophila lebanonensis]|uniref:Translocation protein SEC62 n=1 Tax=Drosophila lebanonensis TaxID=7225 RepID=A0A6J2TQ29_DROLE|nr:translocation protein SEC62 isoform X1 [Scaptodrosophila lebanonensis]